MTYFSQRSGIGMKLYGPSKECALGLMLPSMDVIYTESATKDYKWKGGKAYQKGGLGVKLIPHHRNYIQILKMR